MSGELSRAWAAVQTDRVEDLLAEVRATWWRVHKLASELDAEPWRALDAALLETVAAAREALREDEV